MFGIGTQELLVIFIIALIVLGPKKLPGIARAIGKAVSQFRRAMNGMDDDADEKEREKKDDTDGNGKALNG